MKYFSSIIVVLAFGVTACSEPSAPAGSQRLDPSPRYGKTTIVDPTATVKIPLDDGLLNLKSDRAFSDGTNSIYADGVCGVTARIYLGGSGDMVLLTGTPRSADRNCASYPRKHTVLYPDGFSETGGTIAVDEIQSATFSIPIGSSALRGFHVSAGSVRCEGVHWGSKAGGDSVVVTRTAANTWHITTQPYPNDRAVCKNTVNRVIVGSPLGSMPINLWVVASRNLP